MRILSLILLFVMLLVSSVYAANLNIESITVTPTTVNSGSILNFQVNILNTGVTEITPIEIKTSDATSGSLTLNLQDSPLVTGESLAGFESKTLNFTLTVPSNALAGQYTATLTARETDNPTETDSNSYSFTVVSSPSTELRLNNAVIPDPFSINLESGEDENRLTLTVRNNGNVPLTNVRVSAEFSDLEDDDGDVIGIINPSTIATLAADSSATIEFNFDVESGFDLTSLTGSLRVNADQFSVPDDNRFTLNVKPLACSPNSRSGDLSVEIEQPDDSDDFNPGEIVDVELRIENNGNADIDAEIRAIMYNEDKDRKVDSHTLSKNINEDDEEELTFELDFGDSDEDDQFTLFVKVFDEDDEESSCTIDDVSLDVEIPDHKIAISDLVMFPLSASCGDSVVGSALVRNVGSNDESVTFEFYNTELGLSRISPSFILDELGNRDDEQSVNFEFNVPTNADTGTYTISFRTRYSGESTTATQQLAVTSCGPQISAQLAPSGQTQATDNVPQTVSPLTGTGAVTYQQKDLFDIFNNPSLKIPTLVWVLLDVLLVLLILGSLVWIFRRR